MTPKLAPHEAELIEADAAALYDEHCRILAERMRAVGRVAVPRPAWGAAPEEVRALYLARAADPYNDAN